MDIALRATVIFLALYIVMRLLGKRELGQMTPFELIVLVVIGDLIQQGVTQNDFSLTGAIIAISTFAFLAMLMSWATYLWPWAERLLEGEHPDGPFSTNIFWDRAIAEGRCFGAVHQGLWFDVGAPPNIKMVEEILAQT